MKQSLKDYSAINTHTHTNTKEVEVIDALLLVEFIQSVQHLPLRTTAVPRAFSESSMKRIPIKLPQGQPDF